MWRRWLLTIHLLLAVLLVQAQLQLAFNGKPIQLEKAGIQYAIIQQPDFTDSMLHSIVDTQWHPLLHTKVPISFSPYTFWLRIPLHNISQNGHFDFVHINSPHINRIKCWITNNDSITTNFTLTGDNLPFSTRRFPASAFLFPVNSKQAQQTWFIIAVDKRYTKIDLPIDFCSTAHYVQEEQNTHIIAGLFLGLGLFLLIFNVYLFISIRQGLYLWYSLYLFIIMLYIGTNLGFLFQYIYPNHPEVNDIIRPAILATSAFPLLLFFNSLLSIPSLFPKLYHFNKGVLLVWFIIFIAAITTSTNNNYLLQGFWIQVNRIIGPLLLLVVLTEAFYCLYKKIRFAVFAVLSFSGLTIFITIFSLQQAEIIDSNFFTANANYLGLLFETLVITFSLAWRYKLYKNDSERLLKDNLAMQETLFKETSAWQEQEMGRISSLLHDTVGAHLGLLRLEADNMPLNETSRQALAQHITQVGNDVRAMSHSFSPLVLQRKGLYFAVEDLVKPIRQHSKMNLQLEWVGQKDGIAFQYQIIIYRMVQEIVQNLLKHANATHAFLQIMIEEGWVSIYAEDDGVGMTNANTDGVGLKSIEQLVTVLRGNYRVESGSGDGFSISIEFNTKGHEKI